jgi:hypothetical protein
MGLGIDIAVEAFTTRADQMTQRDLGRNENKRRGVRWGVGVAGGATLLWLFLAVAVLRVSDQLPVVESAYYRGSVFGPGMFALAAGVIAMAIPGRSLVRVLATYGIVLSLGLIHLGADPI